MDEIAQKFERVWKKFCELCDKNWRGTKGDYFGPYLWNEADCKLHLSRLCIDEFGAEWVHNDARLDETCFGHPPEGEPPIIDIVIRIPELYDKPIPLVIEIKPYIKAQKGECTERHKRNFRGVVYADCEKLQQLQLKKYCDYSYLCVIDECNFIDESLREKWEGEFGITIWIWRPSISKS